MKPSRSEFVDLRGRRYHLRVWGDEDNGNAPTIFMLHGWGDTGASFQFVVDALAGNWRVIAPDWRGFGLSQWNDGAYCFADYLADLDALLEHYSPNAPVRVAGHSLGGIVASLYAGIRPARVARLANLEGFGLWVAPADAAPARWARWLEQMRDGDAAFRRYARRADYAQRLLNDNPRLTPERAAFLAEHSLRAAADGGLVLAADPRQRWVNPLLFPIDDAKACWRQVSARTLWVAGRQSAVLARFAETPQEYRQRHDCFAQVNDAQLEDCGHNLHHDQPQAVARLLEDFFA
ncbi:MAG: hydrolase [Proteobacteria bacterium]|nr:hydrolase [Pseudomonadota bacterium]